MDDSPGDLTGQKLLASALGDERADIIPDYDYSFLRL